MPTLGPPLEEFDAPAPPRGYRLGHALEDETHALGEIGEIPTGIAAGATEAVGLALKGLSAGQPTERFRSYLDQIEHGVTFTGRERAAQVPITDDAAYTEFLVRLRDDPGMPETQKLYVRQALEKARTGDMSAVEFARSKLPGAVAERDLWRAGETVSEWAQENFPATPGYEHTLGRKVGEGLGSLGAGIATAIVPGVGTGLSATFFTAMGMGEAADRAAQAGATDEQIIEAAGLGGGAGATDILPAEMLLGRIPGANAVAHAVRKFGGKRVFQALQKPGPQRAIRALAAGGRATGRTGTQAVVEAGQEGGQQLLQNAIAQEVHSPETELFEGVVENMGVGGIVGGVAGLGREGVMALGRRASRSGRGDRARARNQVGPPTAEDEASPIPTADIIEGRQEQADAAATANANKFLEVAGLPTIGQPVRVARAQGAPIEGVVADAWQGDDPGLTIRGPDGSETDLTLAEISQAGATLTGLPMPAPRAEIDAKAAEIAQDAQKLADEAAKAEERAGAVGERQDANARMLEQIEQRLAGLEAMQEQRDIPGGLPRLDQAQIAEVQRLTRAGVPPNEAVRQVTLEPGGVPPGGPPVTREPGGVPGGGPALDISPGGVPAGGPAQDLSPGSVPAGDPSLREPMGPGRRPTVVGPQGRREAAGPETRPEVVGPAGRPDDAGPTDRPLVVGPQGRVETGGPDSRPLVIGPDGRPSVAGPETRPAVTGPSGRREDTGPATRPLIVGPQGRLETGGPDSRPIVIGPSGQPEVAGPESRPVVVGPQGRVETGGPESRPVVIGPAGRPDDTGPEARPLVVGPGGFMHVGDGPDARPVVIGPDGRPTEAGPEARPIVVGPAGRVRTSGPDSRPIVVGPDGFAEASGPEARPQVTGPQGRRQRRGPLSRSVVVGPQGKVETRGPDRRPLVIGPDGFVSTTEGPDSRPLVVGPQGQLESVGPDSRPIVIGPQGRLQEMGPDTRPVVVGPDGRLETLGPERRPLVIGPQGRVEGVGPETRPIVVGPDGFMSTAGPDSRPVVVGPDGKLTVTGPETRPRVGEATREQRAADRMTGRDIDRRRALAEQFAPQTIAEGREARRPRDLPEGFGEGPEARVPRDIPPREDAQARRPTDLPADFGDRLQQAPEVRDLPEDFGQRLAERVAAIPDVRTLDTVDLAERIREVPEIRDIPADVQARMAARVAVEVKQLPEDFGGEAQARHPQDLPSDFGERLRDIPEVRTLPPATREAVVREVQDLPADFGVAEARPIPEAVANRVIDIPAVREIPESARNRLFERVRQEVEDQIEPPDVALGAPQTRAGVPPGEPAAPPDLPQDVRAEGEGLASPVAPPPPLMRANGEPYATEKSAALAARTRGIEATPVEVEGGWGLEQSDERIRAEAPTALPESTAGRTKTPAEEAAGARRTSAAGMPREPDESTQGVETEVREVEAALLRREEAAGRLPDQRVRIHVARQFDEQRARVRTDLDRIGKETFGSQFGIELAESIQAPEGGAVPGAYDPQARIAYVAMRADEEGMTATLMHEGVHHLRQAGAFNDARGRPNAAWRTLEDEARRKWREQYQIDQRYGDTPGLTLEQREDLMNEEAIAEAVADFASHGQATGFKATTRAALTRIMRFFRAISQGLKGRGFRSAEDIMQGDILSGAAGRRADAAARGMPASQAELDRYMQTAWHGSPHRFDRFSTEAIGTGEGNQGFGWGMYFSDSRKVAEWYKTQLSENEQGVTYRVDLAPQEDDYLLWDKPLSEHAEHIQDSLQSEFFLEEDDLSRLTGEDLYTMLKENNENVVEYGDLEDTGGITDAQHLTSQELRDRAGIRGVKYLAGDSRLAGEGSHNYVIFDDADVKIEEILLQRGPATPEANRQEFDKRATDWSGVDLTGVNKQVIKDKERMGGVINDLKAQIKAEVKGAKTLTEGAKVTVEEGSRPKPQDLGVIKRFAFTPLHWSKKFPEINKLVKRGVQTEKDMSNRIQRLNKGWDQITRKLSKQEFAELTGLMFLGDAEAHTFTAEELNQFPINDRVKKAYRESRGFIDKLGRFTEQHNRKMSLNMLTQRTELVRKMAGARGMDKGAFRQLYDARAKLLAQQRKGTGDPETIAQQIDDATTALYGQPEVPNAQFEKWLQDADRTQRRIDDTKIRHREGYVPHKFFGKWRIFKKVAPEDAVIRKGFNDQPFQNRKSAERAAEAAGGGQVVEIDGGWGFYSQWAHVAGEHGFWQTQQQAVRAAAQMSKNDPSLEMRVAPVEFVFPEDEATQISDAAYHRFTKNAGDLLSLQGEDLQDAVRGVARKRFRRRIAGFSQYRKGAQGYSQDLDRVIRTHIGETVRYVSLDELKFDAINLIEKEGLSEQRSSVQDRPVLAAAVNQWFRDVNGQKQVLESQIDNLLNKPWVTPVRGGLAAGAAAFLMTGGPFTAPISPILGAYIGYRVGRGLAQGGPFPTRAITGAMLGDMAHMKLGAFFNLMSALVNTSQVPLNTLPVLGMRDTTEGFIRYNKAILSKLRGRPNADWRLMERFDIKPLDTMAEGTRHQFRKESQLSKISMVFFSTAEGFNRGVTMLGAINKAQRKGWSVAEARRYANETLDRTQFHYGTSDKPEILRNQIARVPLQFKNYAAHQIAFMLGLKRKELPLFLMSLGLLTGTMGMPGLDIIDELTDWLFGFSPVVEMQRVALNAAAEGELSGDVMNMVTRGMPAMLGIDLQGRIGMGGMLPMQARDLKGPWFDTVSKIARFGEDQAKWEHYFKALSPGLGNPLVVLDAWQNGGTMTSPYKRGRPEYTATDEELLIKLIGGAPTRESELRAIREVERHERLEGTKDKRRYVDRIVRALRRGDRPTARRIMEDARADGVRITGAMIRNAMQAMETGRAQRELDLLPREMRERGAAWREAVGAE